MIELSSYLSNSYCYKKEKLSNKVFFRVGLISIFLQKSISYRRFAEQLVRRAGFGETDASFMFGHDFNPRLSF
jgi:hypothetical protein